MIRFHFGLRQADAPTDWTDAVIEDDEHAARRVIRKRWPQACDQCERSLVEQRYRTIVVDPPWHCDREPLAFKWRRGRPSGEGKAFLSEHVSVA